MRMRVHQTDLPADVRGLLATLEHRGDAVMISGRAVHQAHAVGIVQMLVDDGLMAAGLLVIQQPGDDRPGHRDQAIGDARTRVVGMDHRLRPLVGERNISGKHVVEDEVFRERPADGGGLARALVREGLAAILASQQFAQAPRGLVQQRDRPSGGHLLLHRGLRRLQRVVPIALPVRKQFGAGHPVGADVRQDGQQMVAYGMRLGGVVAVRFIPVRRRVAENRRVAGGLQIFADRHEGPHRDVAVRVVLVHRAVLVEHEPLRQRTIGILVAQHAEDDLARGVEMAEGERQLERPLAYVTRAPSRAGILFQTVRRQEMHQGVLHEPRHDAVEFRQTAIGAHLQIIGVRADDAIVLGKHGIGIIDIVENRVVGMKSRGVYETPGGTILMEAHDQLEELCLDRATMEVKKEMGNKLAQVVYEGKWFTPLREAIQAFVESTQEYVTGEVKFKLYKGNIIKAGTTSPYSLYSESLASFTTGDLYDHHDADGFITLFGLPLKVRAMKLLELENKKNN